MKAVIKILSAFLILFFVSVGVNGQAPEEKPINEVVGELIEGISLEEGKMREDVTKLFNKIKDAVNEIKSLAEAINKNEINDKEVIKKLEKDIFPTYQNINSKKEEYRKLLDEFYDFIFKDSKIIYDLIDEIIEDKKNHETELGRLEELKEDRNILIKKQAKMSVIRQCQNQIDILHAINDKLLEVRKKYKLSKDDIGYFFTSCEAMELVLEYTITTVKMKEEADEFLKNVDYLLSIIDIVNDGLASWKELQGAVDALVKKGIDDIKDYEFKQDDK